MNEKDPPPFGYTFTDDFFEPAASPYDNNGQSILSDMENQHLDNFFSNTNPFDLPDAPVFPPALDAKVGAHDYNNWEDYISPATVHRVTTTIPDQAQLQHNFHQEPLYAPSVHTNFLGNTPDELQAATALFNQSQPSYTNGASHSFHGQASTSASFASNAASASLQNALPMGVAPHGLMNEQTAASLHSHNGQRTSEPQFAAQWTASNPPQQHQAAFGPPLHKLDFKRAYTFGTDESFNSPSGYSVPNGHESERHVPRQSIHELDDSQHLLRAVAGIDDPIASPMGYPHSPQARASRPGDDMPSDDAASDEELDDPPAKKHKKNQHRVGKSTPKKAARSGKNRKTSLVEENSKKKRAAAATQKTHRENLTEEQKRNNHILSEQKRRDLIKQGYKDLNEIVPAVRGGGLSKSQVLMEAANFLERLIEDNAMYQQAAA
ncbi:hypothetical protein BDW02DRAFT_559934 [Decorospora gaudefroyi]|uniref:BHLH domain-containing protein n=1 Tax=Decorospora gaudefroyi TaxID=184978 RepID=A0A6A5JYA6_9PLEO|nr:hypothetical protein BDW02DRAFT_559934 [Decorospora gaudefroyi]